MLTSESHVERGVPSASGPSALLRDDRGVIMVSGVFFSLFLIGLCWFIFGIGNAIAYRENLQNASDSAAFAAAVYNARGMNLLAMINIVMGAVLATLVVAKFLEIAAVMSDLEDCGGWITKTEDICKVAETPPTLLLCVASAGVTAVDCIKKCKDITSWQNKLSKYDSGVHTTLKVLHDAEVGIAVGWPWISAGKSGNVQFYYKDGFNLANGTSVTSSFSYSQIPWSLDNDAGSLISGTTATKTAPKPAQTRYGLPVTSDTYADLCIADFNDISSFGGLIPANPLSKFTSVAFDTLSQWFCDDATGDPLATGILEAMPALVEPQATAVCALGDIGKIAKALGSKGGKIGAVVNAATPLPMSMTPPGVAKTDFSYSPMAIYPPAKMGLDYFGVWSTAIGDYDDTLSTKRVQIAGQQAKSGSKIVTSAPDDVYVGVAKAEFYYDPQANDTKDNETKMDRADQPLDVMWNMRWRARLRRYHYFPGADGLGDAAIDLMNTGFSNVATAAVTALVSGKNPLTELVGPEVSVDKLPTSGAPNIFH